MPELGSPIPPHSLSFLSQVCCVILKSYEKELLNMNFQEILLFLQDPPTSHMVGDGEKEVGPILSEAFILGTLYDKSTHLA